MSDFFCRLCFVPPDNRDLSQAGLSDAGSISSGRKVLPAPRPHDLIIDLNCFAIMQLLTTDNLYLSVVFLHCCNCRLQKCNDQYVYHINKICLK